MIMLEPFVLRALLAGLLVAAIAAPLGCFAVWRRMAYFGDSLAHSALLGVALGLLSGIGVLPGVVVVCAVFALLLLWLQQKKLLATDTLLGILAHSALALGMVAVSVLQVPGLNVESYLFGDILTVGSADLWRMAGGGVLVLLLLASHWQALVLMTVHEGLAQAEGVNIFRAQCILMLLMTIIVALSIQVVGILLMTALLIIPAATARQYARSPEGMAVLAAVLGMLAVLLGLSASVLLDTPSGPSIVSAAAGLFFLLLVLNKLMGKR